MNAVLCCLYLFGELSALVAHDHPLPLDRPAVMNPYGTIGLGWEQDFKRTTFYVQVKHTSGIRIRDQGDDAMVVGARLYFGSGQ